MGDLQALLEQAVRRERLVGAQLVVLATAAPTAAAAGVRDVLAGLPVTATTGFEIGSVTKPLVAAALLLAEADGDVDLDAPVADRVPELRPLDPAAAGVTPRQVLSHRSGLAGDYFHDTGAADDALSSYVELLSAQPLDVAPGTTTSYSNGGYVLAGRLLERITGLPFDEALAQRLLRPAGATAVRTWNAPGDDVASGHRLTGSGEAVRARQRFPRALTPAGGVVSSALDLARLVRALTVEPVGALPPWLPERSREALAPLADRPGAAIGWGWVVTTSAGQPLLAHDGGTFGASSFVRVLPERDVVVVLLTGRAGVGAAGHALVDEALRATGHPPLTSPDPAAPLPGAVRRASAVVGCYRRSGGAVDVVERDGGLWCSVTTDGEAARSGLLVAQDSGSWLAQTGTGPLSLVFLGGQDRASAVVVGARAHTRVSPQRAPDRDAPR